MPIIAVHTKWFCLIILAPLTLKPALGTLSILDCSNLDWLLVKADKVFDRLR